MLRMALLLCDEGMHGAGRFVHLVLGLAEITTSYSIA